jgi:catechol 2,3-dioxygenase-like lactoylglutathione lyase family enzyme
MAIIGIQQLDYGVEDVEKSTRFFEDFGLPLAERGADFARFQLAEGSSVAIRPLSEFKSKQNLIEGGGVQKVIWGVDTATALDDLVRSLSVDRDVRVDGDGTAHFVSDFGIPMGLCLFTKRPIANAPDQANAPGNIVRLNRPRKWRERAIPKVISHVVFAIPGYEAGYAFMRDRLNFRLSDYQVGFGMYLRCDGSTNHHNILLLNANAPLPDMDGKLRFHHSNFGVEDIDELMIGANHMTRMGWEPSHFGLGRHRVDSALFYYLPCPAGGEAEYGTDSDAVDDSWVPRKWNDPLFGYAHFVHELPPFLQISPAWDFEYLTSEKLASIEELN